MDIYVLENIDGYLQRMYIIDVYVSFIWTERYSAIGDFEISVFNTKEMRDIFPVDAYIWKYGSRRIMQVETVESAMDDEGNDVLTITGRSLEKILEDRIGMDMAGGTMKADAQWTISGTPTAVVSELLTVFLSQSAFMVEWLGVSMLPSGNLPLPVLSESFTFAPDNLYKHVKDLCDMYNLGFGFIKDDPFIWGGVNSGFHTGAFVGNNRTMSQSTLEPVVFSLSLDSLKNIKLLRSNAGYKNVAYVFGLNGYLAVTADNVDPAISGYAKKILTIADTTITEPVGTALTEALTRRGKAELAKCRPILALDGEIPQNSKYVYGVNYDLGDLVEIRDQDGIVNSMNVTEQIFVSDKEGERTYPTLSFYQTVVPGTWEAYTADRVWDDATGTWLP